MKNFSFRLPTKIVFGQGVIIELGEIIKKEGWKKVFIVTGSQVGASPIMEKVKNSLKNEMIEFDVYDSLSAEPSVEQIDKAATDLKNSGAQVVLAVGGGSRIDAAKALCLLQSHEGSIAEYLFGGGKDVTEEVMPLVCIPTTAGSGSEITGAAVITDEKRGAKLSVTNDYLIPKIAVLDPELHVGMPESVTVMTGMDALTHAIEAYVSKNAEPYSDAFGIVAIKMISENLREAVTKGTSIEARSNMAIASNMAAVAFLNAGLGVVHGIAQTMGAIAGTPHGTANSLILPYAMKKNVYGNPKKFAEIAIAMGEDIRDLEEIEGAQKSVDAVFKLANDIGAPLKMSEIGINRNQFNKIIEGTMSYRLLPLNPIEITEKDVEEILEEAF